MFPQEASTKKQWEDLGVLVRKTVDATEQSADDAALMEDYSKFFIEMINHIRKDIDGDSKTDHADKICHQLSQVLADDWRIW